VRVAHLGRDLLGRLPDDLKVAYDGILRFQVLPERDVPDYVAQDGNDKITFARVPKLDEVPYPVTMEPNLVVEFYSR